MFISLKLNNIDGFEVGARNAPIERLMWKIQLPLSEKKNWEEIEEFLNPRASVFKGFNLCFWERFWNQKIVFLTDKPCWLNIWGKIRVVSQHGNEFANRMYPEAISIRSSGLKRQRKGCCLTKYALKNMRNHYTIYIHPNPERFEWGTKEVRFCSILSL